MADPGIDRKVNVDEVRAWLGVAPVAGEEAEVSGVSCRAQEVRAGDLFVVMDEYLSYNTW